MIVDDHPIVRQGLRAALEKVEGFTIVGEADNADDAISAVEMLSPDLVMLDIRLKGGRSGIEVANDLRAMRSGLKIVILTNHAQEPYLRAMIEAGVDGYLLKDTPPGQIVEAIEKVVAGKNVFSESLVASVPTAYIGSEASGDLSSVEAEVLQMMADGATNQEIASRLQLERKLVQMHLARSFAKLGVTDRDAAIARAAEEGMIVIDEWARPGTFAGPSLTSGRVARTRTVPPCRRPPQSQATPAGATRSDRPPAEYCLSSTGTE